MKLYLDPGYGGTDTGAQGNGMKEKDISLDIAKFIKKILEESYEDIEVKMSRTSDITKSLSQRTNEANRWGADFFLSIHCNSLNGAARGYEDFIYSSLSESAQASKYQGIIHAEVIKVNNLSDMGQKKADVHVLRETAMPALLTKNGFIDNPEDAALMKESLWRQKVAQGHVNGIVKAFNLKPLATDLPSDYKVIAGSFKSKEFADERVLYLLDKGVESLVVRTSIEGALWYRVQAGAFQDRAEAEKRLLEVKKAGIIGAFIFMDSTDSSSEDPNGYSIIGKTYLSPEQMNHYAKKINPNAINLGFYYNSFGEHYGVRGDIAFAQAMLETDFLRFTGDGKAGQNNFGGLSASGDDASAASFSSPKEGVLSHIQHLFAYASTKPFPPGYPLVDPRFHLVERGAAAAWKGLNGRWAVPGINYGESIINIYKSMVREALQDLEKVLNKVDM